MKNGKGALLLAFLASSLFCLTSARNRVCINANSQVLKLYCDGVDYTHLLKYRSDRHKCDCLWLPVCKIIALKAKGIKNGQKSMSAVNVCQTSNPAPYKDWVCKAAPKVSGTGWTSVSYNHNQRWKKATKPDEDCSEVHCHPARKIPCYSKCFWNPFPPAAAVACVVKQCALDCDYCAATGPGNCDPGRCRNGIALNTYTNVQTCRHKCRLEWKAYNGTTTGKGYVKLIDTVSESVDKLVANDNGIYLAAIDMIQCTFTYKNYSVWEKTGYNGLVGAGGRLIAWSGDSTGPMKNNIALHIGVGSGVIQLASPAPAPSGSLAIYILGKNAKTYMNRTDGATTAFFWGCGGRVDLSGVQNGQVLMDSWSLTPC